MYSDVDDDANDDDNEVPIIPTSGKKKAGRKCQWSETTVTDLVEVILENDKYKTKLLLTNTKNTKNGVYYGQVIAELSKKLQERGEEFNFDTQQTRSKFKRCVSLCRKAALTIKTASGIKRFQEEKEFGPWFEKLYQVVCTMANSQPEQSIEPHVSNKENVEDNDIELETSESVNEEEVGKSGDDGPEKQAGCSGKKKRKNFFVPDIKSKKSKHVLDQTMGDISKTLGDLTEALKDNSSKELVNFLKEDAQRQQVRDQMFMTLMQTMVTSGVPRPAPQPQPAPQPYFYPQVHPLYGHQFMTGNSSTGESSNSEYSKYDGDNVLDNFHQKK